MQPSYDQYSQHPTQQLPPPQSAYTPPEPGSPKNKGPLQLLKGVGIVFSVLLLIGGAFFAGLSVAPKPEPVAETAKSTEESPVESASTAGGIHYIVSRGTPVQPKNPVSYTTKIGLPRSLQGIRTSSTIPNTSTGFAIFGNGTFNNELARIAIGNADDPYEDGGSIVTLTAITKEWLASTGATNFSSVTSGFPSGVVMNTLQTPADKKAFMDALPLATATCAKDSAKGFKTDDGTLAACYVTTYGKDGYAPVITFVGYSNVNNQPAVFYGQISINDTTVTGDAAAQQAAIQAAREGSPTAYTATAQTDMLTALKQSSIIITKI